MVKVRASAKKTKPSVRTKKDAASAKKTKPSVRTKKDIFRGELVENRIVIWNLDSSRAIFKGAFYGKPLGVPKPKGDDFNAPLILDLIEGYYLATNDKLRVFDVQTKKRVSRRKIKEKCESEYVQFNEKFLVYEKLRNASYVVTPGIKFGCDFAVYEHGPGIDHAPYLVQVMKPGEDMTGTGIVLAGRLATTVKKQFLIALPQIENGSVEFVSFDWWRA